MAELMEKWASLKDFSADDRPDEPGAWNLVYNLRHIEGSCRALLDSHLPNLTGVSEKDALMLALADIGVELTHLLWHIRNLRAFGDLTDSLGPPDH
ncbi:MAG: hypothetical protein WEE67_10715 [Chloroflexota bacterium]